MIALRVRQLAGLTSAVLMFAAAPGPPRTRNFHFEYKAVFRNIPAGVKTVDLWMPLAHTDEYQQIRNVQIDAPQGYRVETADHGNTMVHVRLENPQESTATIAIRLDATRMEHVQTRIASGPPLDRDEDPKKLAEYLKPDRLVPLDDQIRAWAREVVEKANAHTDVEMARAIYNHIVATVKYDKTGKGWGRGDIYYACAERRGNCTDFHAIFIGYARAMGIPARFAIGFPLPADRGAGKIAGYHCWAEFYAKGIGWVPVDASEAGKDPSKREYFFGAHDENRIELSKGRDVILAPRQSSEPLNYFVYPYGESDGKPLEAASYEVTYQDAATAAAEPADRAMERADRNSQIAHEQLLEKRHKGRIDVYFEGDSITRRWGATDPQYAALLANWRQNFFGWNAADFGWGADRTQNILWRLQNGELDGVNPKIIVLLAGTNNVGGAVAAGSEDAKVADVTRGIAAIVEEMRRRAPKSVIVLMGITPRNDRGTAVVAVIDRINASLAKLADGTQVRYVNINGKLADQDGKLYPGMTGDGLHFTAQGYQVWADALKPIFTEILGPRAATDEGPPATGDPSVKGR